ncbi:MULTISPECIES: glycosyltransferase [unclassified Colwellia]|uniref:glycosyltransferase n=1 Tax=unclassified Colwellia TaxID=196834 RepID=UPI0015F67545|nr:MULTISPECIES: glycosyltransferase [unclassified Colwellia]MBA6357432.1 glycosyltransferase [Colwellia sp. BRX8-3]MBA6361616.1 glycosyltransferase [Colwellia sp. BRX8-6]MBA6369137.1 glycosyltransferase [Colwellia sp. BRX8-5]MBA6374916.1 glycosyltransferase [Colwellia sp. BRX8-2]
MSQQKVRVLQFICSTGFYGAERWILALAKNLPKDSVQCDLVVTLEDNSKNLELVKEYKKQDIGQVFEVPMRHKFDFSVVNKLAKIIKDNGYDVIHTHGYKSDILGVLAAKKAGIRSVITPHGFENAEDIKLRLFIWLGNRIMKYANVVVPLSKALCEDVKGFGVKDSKIVYVQNGVDLSEVEEQKVKFNKLMSVGDAKRIGFVGQMISRKNIHDILDIFETLAGKYPNISLSLLGDGESRAELEEHTKSLNHKNRIEFMGYRDDRLELLQSFDLFVMTSTLEGIPRCLMEATAMGIPVAAYNIAGVDQLIEHQKTGLLAPFGEKEILATYWEELLFDEEKAKKLSDNACEFVNENYAGKRMATEYIEVFKQLLNGKYD